MARPLSIEDYSELARLLEQAGFAEINVANLKGRLLDPQNAGEFQGRDVSDAAPDDGSLMIWSEQDEEWAPMPGESFMSGFGLGDLGDVGTVEYEAGKVLRADGDSYESAVLNHSDLNDDEPLQHIDWTNATQTFKTTGWAGFGVTPETSVHIGGSPGYLLLENDKPVCWKDSGGTIRGIISLDESDNFGILADPVLMGGYFAYVSPDSLLTLHGNLQPAKIWLRRVDNTPEEDDLLGELKFAWANTSGSKITYGSIRGIATDVSSGQEKGALTFLTADVAGAGFQERMRLNLDGVWLPDGILALKELSSTPSADANYGKVYTKSTNRAYFQDGDGTEHTFGDAKEEHIPLITLATGQSF